MATAPFLFELPSYLRAKEPLENRGMSRDQARLLVIHRDPFRLEHAHLRSIGNFLQSGDLLVFNTSRTLPASLQGCIVAGGPCLEVRLAEHLPDDSWLALLLYKKQNIFDCGIRTGLRIEFSQDFFAVVESQDSNISPLWKLRFSRSGLELTDSLYRLGQPIRYEYVSAPWNLELYQTIFAREPGSAEMPSAGRGFTWKLLFDLKRRGIQIAYVVLHTTLSSYMDDALDEEHPVSEEEYFVNEATAEKIRFAKAQGRRVIAVGTTVVRALESAVSATGQMQPGHRYTSLRIDVSHALRIVDGLLTGFHEPNASHLDLLTAFLPAGRIREVYEEAIRHRYLWHEFGDLNLIL
jgi:S-adenosylmethionine:tRNA ribosyltransferase-isomerase